MESNVSAMSSLSAGTTAEGRAQARASSRKTSRTSTRLRRVSYWLVTAYDSSRQWFSS